MPWRRDRLPTPVFLGFPCGSGVKNLPVMWETWIQPLGWEDPLEKEKATHSSILAWRILVHGVPKSQTLSLSVVVIWGFFFLVLLMACRILIPLPGTERSSVIRAQSPNHWNAREVLKVFKNYHNPTCLDMTNINILGYILLDAFPYLIITYMYI